MRRREALPELLSPAGNFEALIAAVHGGADAVYVGGESFGARAYAKNFNMDELLRAVRYTHLHGVKLYVTVNTLVYDREMRELSDYIAELWRIGVDALITADLGVISEIKRRTPKFPIHASTQMSVHNTLGAEAAAGLGCERVVIARELSRENIAEITNKCSVETEVFLHGALCVSHSGQCLMSSLVGGRSGNRGECAQPCRLPYNNGKHVLSLQDLSLAAHVKELVEMGVASLKIEGRMKSPEYVYRVTSIYRKLLDENRNATEKENKELKAVFSRDGFTDGYFLGRKTLSMTGVRSEEDKKRTNELSKMKFEPQKKRVFAKVAMKLGEPSVMTVFDGRKSVTVEGEAPTAAINSPLFEKDVKARLSKMGATMLSLDPSDIELSLDKGINLSPAAVNALRRSAAERFECQERKPAENGYIEKNTFNKNSEKSLKTAQFFSNELYLKTKELSAESLGFFDIIFLPLENFAGGAGVSIPPVVFDTELPQIEKWLERAKELGAKYALVGNIGAISLAKKFGLVPIGDFRLNVTNAYAKEEYSALGVEDFILSPELTLPMARDIVGGEIVYGRIPLMLTERCFIKESFGCENCANANLEDRTGAKFPMISEFGHRNVILNSVPTYMGDKKEELKAAKISHAHFLFTTEAPKEIHRIISAYKESSSLGFEVRRIGRRRS